MNIDITEGVQLMPPAFRDGLKVWSSGEGIEGSPTYDQSINATLISADKEFGDCLEMLKVSDTQMLRFTGRTQMVAGCYLRIGVRLKAVSGPLAWVNIAGWAGDAAGNPVTGLTRTGTPVALENYGKVVEISAIVGSGRRSGVELVWGLEPAYGHFGIDLTGLNGGVVRIDNILIEDATSVFHSWQSENVDVRDYGAVGDGVTDNTRAFQAADAAAAGRMILVPEGRYFLGGSVSIASEIRFIGTVVMPDDATLHLAHKMPTSLSAKP